MRFGITPINIDNITSMFDKDKGLSSFLNFRYSDVVLDAVEMGYQHCEMTLDLFQILQISISDKEIQKLKNIKKTHDITYSAHLPIWSIELASPNRFIREASVESLIDSYKKLKSLEPEIDVFVLHPSGAFVAEIMKADIEEKYKKFISNLFINLAVQSVKKFIKETKIDKTKIAIENIKFPFEGTLEIIKKLNGPKLCIDTAHALGGYSGEIDLVEITKENLDLTCEIHLQDFNAGKGADHAALGTGNFPVEFLKVIYDYDFKGPIVFELSFEQAKKSLSFIKNHAPEIKLPEIKS